jgi:hypothetical protein
VAADRRLQEGGRPGRGRLRPPVRETLRCGTCGASHFGGLWTWAAAPDGTPEGLCPACHRIQCRRPAGDVALKGTFLREHESAVMRAVCDAEREEKADHPLERIMAVEQTGEGARVTTTGVRLARRIGETLSKSYQGRLVLTYSDGDRSVRVLWER